MRFVNGFSKKNAILVVGQLFHGPIGDQVGVKLADGLAGVHIKVDIISALDGALSGHFPLEVRGGGEYLLQQLNGALQGQQAVVEQGYKLTDLYDSGN